MCSELLHGWRVAHLVVIEAGLHGDEGLVLVATPERLVCGKGPDHHLSNGVEDPALPIIVVCRHLKLILIVGLEGHLLDTSQVHVSDVAVVFDKLSKQLNSMLVKELGELTRRHLFLGVEGNLPDKHGVLDIENLCFN